MRFLSRWFHRAPEAIYRDQLRAFAATHPAHLELPPIRELKAVKAEVREDLQSRLQRFRERMAR